MPLGVHGLDGSAAANFVLSNLESAARIEIKCRPAGEREDVEKLFRALEEVYGETLTSSQLLRQFYERHQGERESMSDLAHALVLLLDRLHSVDSTAVRNKDRMLREQFLENVRSVNLRWDLKRRVEQDPETTFLAVRKVPMFWAREVENEPAPKMQVRISQQEAVTDCRGAEASMREVGLSGYTEGPHRQHGVTADDDDADYESTTRDVGSRVATTSSSRALQQQQQQLRVLLLPSEGPFQERLFSF